MSTRKGFCVVAILVICVGIAFANDVSGNQQNQSVVVNVTIPQGNAIPEGAVLLAEKTHSLGLGLSAPIYGTEHNVIRNGQVFTEKMTGINWGLGYTWRHYFGDGLPQVGGALYWEFMTLAIVVPMVGIGYEYRFNDTIRMGFGYPDLISLRISL